MTSIGSTTGATTAGASGATSADGTQFSTGTDRTALDTNTFLKLLVAQLQYQDPSNPTDSTQFMAQTAQFTSVEKMSQLTTLTQQVLQASSQQTATSLVGKTVTYNDVSGASHTGVVSATTVGAQTPNLTIDGLKVELTAVTSVVAGSTASSTASSTTSSSTT